MDSRKAGAVILAAGQGKRLGMGPKAYVLLDGKTLLERAFDVLKEAHIDEIVAVLPALNPDQSLSLIPCVNPSPEDGQLSSVVIGLNALPFSLFCAFVFPVDHGLIEVESLSALLRAAQSVEAIPEDITHLIPTFQGKPGHPILLLPRGLAALKNVENPKSTTLRNRLQKAGKSQCVPVKSPYILSNINRPEDFKNALKHMKMRNETPQKEK